MALLFSSCVHTTPYSSSTMLMPITLSSISMKPFALHLKSCPRFCFVSNKRGALAVKASIETLGLEGGESQSESDDDEDDLPFNEMPLDSKLQLKLEHKMRMKLSKKIRLRGKKLVRKRRMRKKGRWPPSKMKKLKNV